MATKVIMKFKASTESATWVQQPGPFPIGGAGGVQTKPEHVGSFTEYFWTTLNSIAEITAALKTGVGLKRARLLPSTATLSFARLYQDGGGRGTVVGLDLPGGTALTDIPQMALLCQSNNAAASTQRRFFIHCIPDTYVYRGEFSPTQAYNNLVIAYLNELANYQFRSSIRTNQTTIFNISNAGLVTLNAANPFSAGNIVTISRSRDSSQRNRGGKFSIASVGPGANQFTLTGWQWGATTGGSVYVKTYGFANMSGCTITRIGTRRVGRPFDSYVGRRSVRR